ncbi:hypothetical protein [Acuticoccus kandeliae]|uniref:hypothetical protein n=1 Tax=Acuticoccus kandeliae TaxID=2073160 RepID=UPI0013009479|nr:hypothetical protein [Acuticoccus kandeliae]
MKHPITLATIVVGSLTAAAAGTYAFAQGPEGGPGGPGGPGFHRAQFAHPMGPMGPMGGPRAFGPGGMRGPGGMAMMRMMRDADTDGDKALSQEEIDAYIAGKIALGDANGDGEISLEEYEAIWLDLTRPMMVRSFQFFDADGNALVTTEEVDDVFGDTVERFDRNKDGKLSQADRPRKMRGERRGWRRGGPDRERGEMHRRHHGGPDRGWGPGRDRGAAPDAPPQDDEDDAAE